MSAGRAPSEGCGEAPPCLFQILVVPLILTEASLPALPPPPAPCVSGSMSLSLLGRQSLAQGLPWYSMTSSLLDHICETQFPNKVPFIGTRTWTYLFGRSNSTPYKGCGVCCSSVPVSLSLLWRDSFHMGRVSQRQLRDVRQLYHTVSMLFQNISIHFSSI